MTAATLRQALEALREALARRSVDRPCLVRVPAPLARPERVWDADPRAPAVFWATAEGAWAGLGAAAVVAAEGADALTAAGAGLARVQAAGWDAGGGPPPLLFGGAAFATPGGAAGPWKGFGDARFVLPRWTYRLAAGRAELALALPPGPHAEAALAGELAAVFEVLAAAPPPWRARGAIEPREDGQRTWAAAVAAAQQAIAAGGLHKVVLVRRTEVRLPSTPPGSVLLGRLGEEGDGLFRFGFRLGGAVFAGVSPELLVARRGPEVRAEALAASVPRPPAAAAATEAELAARLLADAKQRHEHELVVEAVCRDLRPVCRELAAPAAPAVRALRHLLHLSTPVVGTLAHPLSLLELAARLHPTPAVAGEPREAAMAFIAAHERHPRGWFSGPVGRVTPEGEGELAVALRSVLVRGRTAYVYAGAGIVAGSRAELELAETRAKARTCLAALGVHA
ncbi:MAG TPA: isochorismate synthase [Thermoanaerobaculaceae bacterium]|nr:isochorismate synthase [Thermoanaerobaculaceae bacterium]HRS15637.1 isochorismate synthase [Thermoanaerobaculaceae bacterium]